MALDTVALSRLRIRLGQERVKAIDRLSAGTLMDMRDYGYSCGYIKAVDDAVMLLDEIISDLQGE